MDESIIKQICCADIRRVISKKIVVEEPNLLFFLVYIDSLVWRLFCVISRPRVVIIHYLISINLGVLDLLLISSESQLKKGHILNSA